MKKLLLASTTAVALLALGLTGSKALANPPQCCGPYGWLACKALKVCPHIHSHGPLYNYGPYYSGPGYQDMYVNSLHGRYVPAYPTAYYYGAGAGYAPPNGYANPAMSYPAPVAPPGVIQTIPAVVTPVSSTTYVPVRSRYLP